MNAAVKTLSHREGLQNPILVAPKVNFATLLLLLVVLLSGLAVIYVADINRRLAIQVENNMALQNQLHTEWGKLLLEQSTWSTQARVQNLAAQKFNMQPPARNQVVIVKV